ncbi:MAG: cytochrome c family protein [Desulfovibrionaceae bacterium]
MTIRAIAARLLFVCAVIGFLAVGTLRPAHTDDAHYVGSAACKDCHETEYANFCKYSKKVHSAEAVKTMAPDLTPEELKECFHCHTTGYGEPGGFVSFEKTPELANAGCEVCHGPGSRHVEEFGDTEYIKGKLTIKDCERCHNPERVAAFDYKPLIYGGAH